MSEASFQSTYQSTTTTTDTEMRTGNIINTVNQVIKAGRVVATRLEMTMQGCKHGTSSPAPRTASKSVWTSMQESTWSSADTITAAKSKTTTRSSNASTRYSTSSGSDAAGAIGSVADLLAAERRYLQVIDDRIAGNEHDVIICNSASRSIIRNSASCSTTPLSEEQHGHSESILLPHDTMSFVDNESDADIEVVAEHCRDAETLDNDEQLSDKALLEGLQEVEDALRAGLDEFGLDSVTGQHVVHSAVAAKRAADVEELDPIPRDVEDDAECTDAEILEKLVAHVRGELKLTPSVHDVMKEIALRSDFDFACGHPCSSNNDNNDSEPVPLEEFLEAEKDRSLGHYDPVSGFIITAPRYSIFPTISMEEEQSDSTLAHLAVIRPDPFVAGLWAVMGDGSVRNATERRAVRRAVFQELKQLGSLSSSKSQLLGFSEDNLASQVQYPDAFQYSASNAHQDNDMFGQVPPQRPQMDLYDMVMRQYQNDLLAEQQLQQKAKKSKRAQRPLRLRRKRLYRKKNKKQVETVQSENDMEPVESMRYATISSINISTLDAAPIPLVTPRTTFYQRVRAIFQRKSPKVHPA